MTVIYGSDVANGTLATASTMSSTTGGTEVSQTTTVTGTNVWVEVVSRSATLASVTAIGSPSGKGWVFSPGLGSFAAGNWSASVTLSGSSPGTTDITVRFYQYSGGVYTSIGTINKTGVVGAKTTYAFAATSMPATSFAASDLLYVDLWWHDTGGANDNPVVYESNSASQGVVSDMQVTTSTFTAGSTNTRTIPATAALLSTNSRTIPATASLQITSRTIPATAALQATVSRTIPATAALTVTSTRTIPASASLAQSAVFYASNVAQTLGGLTQSDQMAQVSGGTETSFTVTMPSSGTNAYVELLAQGGTATSTPVLPSPTGKGWSIALSGNTILAGSWNGAFTLAKSGTSMSGASLYVRWYRRTIDGIYYTIGSSTLTAQTYSTTKTVYTTPTVTVNYQWQFVSGDTLYMDAFVFNGSTAWASDVFTVYVSNSASLGVYNDGIIVSPQLVATPAGLNCLIGASSFQTANSGLPVLNQSFTLADAIDQRSILTLTGEDSAGTLSYQRAMPTQFSDHDQGLLYTGFVNSDKVSKVAAGGAAQLEHQLTFMDPHYLVDKRANQTNYLNWTAGDMVCDFIQSTLSQEGITGQFALESTYTPTTFGQGTLSGTVATTTTSPFVYAPNTASPPATSNTGDLELTRAGTQFTLTEQTSGDFGGGTLNNMTASNNTLAPTTVSALKMVGQFINGAANISATNTATEIVFNSAYAKIWSGSFTIGSNDTLNYDIWISSTSPAFMAGVDFLCSDGTTLTSKIGTPITNNSSGLYDSNNFSVDALTDLSDQAKNVWYTRTITLTGLNGKTLNTVSLFMAGSASGSYTIFVKNIYLGSQSGSPFFGTAATAPNVNPPTITTIGGYVASTFIASVVNVFNPLTSYRVSSAHSISGVGLVQNSTITWTAALPTSGGPSVTYPPGVTTSASSSAAVSPAMLMMVSYDANTWLLCSNQSALPGLPPGANVAGLSLYLREQFQAGSDPSAIPSLEQVSITINSAANQTTSDVTAHYGQASDWNGGTEAGAAPNANGDLTLVTQTRDWNDGLITNQTLFPPSKTFVGVTESASTNADVISYTTNSLGGRWAQSRYEFVPPFLNGTIECDVMLNSTNHTTSVFGETGIEYRQTGWSYPNNTGAYLVCIAANGDNSSPSLIFGYGTNQTGASSDGTFTTVVNYTTSITVNMNTYYHLKVVVNGAHHQIYFNNATTPQIDILDYTYMSAGSIALRGYTTASVSATASHGLDNLKVTPASVGTWTSPSISLSALGTVGYNQISWQEQNPTGATQAMAIVQASLDGGSTWQTCTNGAEIPQLATRGTSVSGKSLLLQVILASNANLTTPILWGLYVRVCGPYGTVTGTRISPALSLTPVGYVAASNCMWNSNVPTNTTLVVATSQDASTWTNVGNSGAGAALGYWSNQPSATQDLFSSNTSANYTNTNKTGGSTATVTYDTTNSRLTLAGGSGGLYLNNAISTSDVDELVDMDESDAGGLVWRKVDASNYYELGVYDASSSGGFTNQLRLYKVASGTRSLLGSASSITFTRGTFHRPRVTMQGGLINVYWDGTCVQSYLDTSPLGSGACGLRNDGGTSRYYQLWVQPLGVNLSGQALYTRVTMTTTDPSQMPQLFTLVAAIRGPSIGTGATISQLHPVTTPFASYYSSEMDTLVQASGDYYWYVDKWKQLHFGPRLARPGAFPVQSVYDTANSSGYLLYVPQVTVLSSADLYRGQQIVTNVTGTVTPPPETKVADGSTTSWTLGYPVYSAPTILINGQGATVGVQGIDNGRQFYWQPGSASISYDSSLPKLPAGTILSITYVGESTVNVVLNNTGSQTTQAALELNSGIVAGIESALRSSTNGMTTAQATTFGNGLLSRYGNNGTIELIGTTRYQGLAPGTVIPLFLPEIGSVWNSQLPIVKLTTTAYMSVNGIIYLYSIDATNGPSLSNWTRVFFT